MFGPDVEAAKAICAGCPVKRDCLNFALDNDIDSGVWGAATFDERVRICPICRRKKRPESLGCSSAHSILRLSRLMVLQSHGDTTISVSSRAQVTARTSPVCAHPRGRPHATAKAYKSGCRCRAALLALRRERARRVPHEPVEPRDSVTRFLALARTDPDGHWRWMGALNGSAYGNFWDGSRTVRAHLFAYRALVGPIPEGARLHAGEGCRAVRCVNPAHYEIAGGPNATQR